jgi:hypothetical protein
MSQRTLLKPMEFRKWREQNEKRLSMMREGRS